MNWETFHASSEEETIAIGRAIGARLPRRCVVLLEGNLGAGKTTITKGIVEGMGAASGDEVSSPTFTLIQEYGDPVRVYHIDLYRLEEPRELFTLGLEEIFERNAVVLIEWADKFPRMMPEDALRIRLTHDGGARRIEWTP